MVDTLEYYVEAACTSADSVINTHGSGKRELLYSALVCSAHIAALCAADTAATERLAALFLAQPRGQQKRRYVERQSDIYTRVCRYVFADTNRSNISRYAHVLREAAKSQISPDALESHLLNNGGVNALFFKRPIQNQHVMTSTLHLTRAIRVSRSEHFVVKLRWTDNNTFEPLE